MRSKSTDKRKKKLIIGKIGDSRLVIFKNGLVSCAIEDNKPDSHIEKKRIEAVGWKIYKLPPILHYIKMEKK